MTDFEVGDRIQFSAPGNHRLEPLYFYGRQEIAEGTVGTAVQVGTNKVRVTFDGVEHKPESPYYFWVEKDGIELADPNAPKPRRLGDVPDDGISIGPDDPRIAWLWKDAEKLATAKGYCSQYDVLTGVLNIPGRARTFKVTVTLAKGITTTISNKAHSKAEAEENVRKILAEAKPTVGTASE